MQCVTKFPLDEEARDRIRAEITEDYLLRASHTASQHMRSLRCQKGDHRCRNSGETCLCYCHDRKFNELDSQHYP